MTSESRRIRGRRGGAQHERVGAASLGFMVVGMMMMINILCSSIQQSTGFQQSQQPIKHHSLLSSGHRDRDNRHPSTTTRLAAVMVDPNDVHGLLSTFSDMASSAAATATTTTGTSIVDVVDPNHLTNIPDHDLPSTMISSAAATLKTAHGHSNSWFGPHNQLLDDVPCQGGFWQSHDIKMCAKSIRPTKQGLEEVQNMIQLPSVSSATFELPSTKQALQQLSNKGAGAGPMVPKSINPPTTTTQMTVQTLSSENFPSKLPVFNTKSIFQPQDKLVAPGGITDVQDYQRFAASMIISEKLWRFINKAQVVLIGYALIEFFVLRSSGVKDLYKEDIEEDPSGVTTEVVSDVMVRVGIFLVLTAVTFALTPDLTLPPPTTPLK